MDWMDWAVVILSLPLLAVLWRLRKVLKQEEKEKEEMKLAEESYEATPWSPNPEDAPRFVEEDGETYIEYDEEYVAKAREYRRNERNTRNLVNKKLKQRKKGKR